ncbi:MAG: hypothetical protein ISQ09_12380 [Rubripirellula sp.]|nr:hypothetical protein [Rubripirellula sp.]
MKSILLFAVTMGINVIFLVWCMMMSRILKERLWTVVILLTIFAANHPTDVSAMGRNGILSKLKSGEGGCFFSCHHGAESEMVSAETTEGDAEVAPAESVEETSEGKRRSGLFARIRSKKSEKEMTTDAQDLNEQSSSDLPVEEIPPAPKS